MAKYLFIHGPLDGQEVEVTEAAGGPLVYVRQLVGENGELPPLMKRLPAGVKLGEYWRYIRRDPAECGECFVYYGEQLEIPANAG